MGSGIPNKGEAPNFDQGLSPTKVGTLWLPNWPPAQDLQQRFPGSRLPDTSPRTGWGDFHAVFKIAALQLGIAIYRQRLV